MSVAETLQEGLNRLQTFASDYFEVMHKINFAFWRLPEIPSGGNILTGGFAAILIGLAQAHMSQNIAPAAIGLSVTIAFFYVLLICGLLVFLDPYKRPGDTQKLISVVCSGITLGCALIILDRVFLWIEPLWSIARPLSLSGPVANLAVAAVATLFAGVLLWLNTAFQFGVATYVTSIRMVTWSLAILGVICVGITLIISTV